MKPTVTKLLGLSSVLAFTGLVVIGCRGAPAVGVAACAGCSVVLVSMDTLRADHVGIYGYQRPTTPNIDRLARDSVLFEDALSQSAWTRPAHFSMLTGLYPNEHGVVSMSGHARVPDEVSMLASVLRRAGYHTAAFTGGANLSAHFGFDRGFDVYLSRGKRLHDNVAAITAWLEARGERPFFLFLHGLDAHRPYLSDRQDREAMGVSTETTRRLRAACRRGEQPDDLAYVLGAYDAAIHRGDRALGSVLDRLAQLGLTERTVVILTSDHGEEFFDHGGCYHIYTLHREILRVPLVVRVPGLVSGRVSGVVPASVSIAPTILELVGASEERLPGPSLVPALRRREADFDYVVSETGSRSRRGPRFGRLRAITGNDEKLIHWVDHGRYEYFDLRSDPLELRPITTGRRNVELRRRLGAWVLAHPVRPGRRAAPALPASLRRELRSLGYLE